MLRTAEPSRPGLSTNALPPQLYSIAETAADISDSAEKTEAFRRSGGGILAPLTNSLEALLGFLQHGLDTLHVPYSYGYSIILLTLVVKTLAYPLTKQQVESNLAVQSLKPRIDLIKARYGDDKEKVSKETNVLYEQAGVNPLAGCLPSLASIPIFIGLYSSLTNVANEGLLDTQGFYWIPSLAGPTTIAARQAGSGTAWLFPIIDGHPASGWDQAGPYLVFPVLLVVAQWISSAIISPPMDPNDPNARTTKIITSLLPLMVGWFSLNVPSGLALYYFSNTVITTGQQVYLRKLGGANIQVKDLGPVTKPGSARRTGVPARDFMPWQSQTAAAIAAAEAASIAALDNDGAESVKEASQDGAVGNGNGNGIVAEASSPSQASAFVVKRKRLDRMAQV